MQVPIMNSSARHTLKATIQDGIRDEKTLKLTGKYKKGTHIFIPPGKSQDIWLDQGKAILLEEMPS